MIAAKKGVIYFVCLMIIGCIFSHDDLKEYKISDSFYISSFAGDNTLLYKVGSDIKLKGSGTVVIGGIDSIAWNDKYIFGKTISEYFIINKSNRNFVGKYQTYLDFQKSQQLLEASIILNKASNFFK